MSANSISKVAMPLALALVYLPFIFLGCTSAEMKFFVMRLDSGAFKEVNVY